MPAEVDHSDRTIETDAAFRRLNGGQRKEIIRSLQEDAPLLKLGPEQRPVSGPQALAAWRDVWLLVAILIVISAAVGVVLLMFGS